MRRLLVSLATVTVLSAPALPGQDAKEKEAAKDAKDKDKAKPKAPPRTYSNDDLKKYKDKPKDEGGDAQAGSGGESGGASAAEPAPRQRRSREYGGFQELPPPPPPTTVPAARTAPQVQEPAASEPAETKSAEEVEWKRRAVQAHRPLEAAQAHIAQIETEMAGLKDQLNPMSTSYVLGGNSTAGPGAVLEIEEKLRNLESRRADAKGELAEAEKGWQAFLEEGRAAGVNPNWLTP